jgi:hypothetical protein
MLIEVGERKGIGLQWAIALTGMEIRHLDPEPTVELELIHGDPPKLCFRLDVHRDTVDRHKRHRPFVISTVSLTFFPGAKLSRMWVAAAFAGYVAHEALELVTADGVRPIDPHAIEAHDMCLRDGLPVELDAVTLARTLGLVMRHQAVTALLEEAGIPWR